LVEDGDRIEIDIPARRIHLAVDDAELGQRRAAVEQSATPWQPRDRQRVVSKALQAYAHFATSADRGAVRDLNR
ncbi:dihydroxy-acid dehydratase, partial [Immundisolibacter sp.]|uniref:dihydroxy-acid dehydratase domain-containing protein n=1 Tax=Immundisolibacter sp. TaxID=1934948 RepID=UPI003562C28C